MLTGDAINVDEAHRLGMVSKVFPLDELEEQTLAYARRIAELPTMTALLIKESVNQTVDNMGFYNSPAGVLHPAPAQPLPLGRDPREQVPGGRDGRRDRRLAQRPAHPRGGARPDRRAAPRPGELSTRPRAPSASPAHVRRNLRRLGPRTPGRGHGRRAARHVRRARRGLQPLRPSAAGGRPGAGGPHRGGHGEPPPVPRGGVGGPALRALRDRGQLAPDGGRGRVHRRRLRWPGARHQRRPCRAGRRHGAADPGGAAAPHGRRRDRRPPGVRSGDRRTAGHGDRRREPGHGHALQLGDDRAPQGRQVPAARGRRQHRGGGDRRAQPGPLRLA